MRSSSVSWMFDGSATAIFSRPSSIRYGRAWIRVKICSWIDGEKVDDVTTHPAFRNGARSVARLYNALHDPATKDVLTVETDTGNGGFTHPFFRAPTSADDLVRGRDAIAAWQRLTYGWMG